MRLVQKLGKILLSVVMYIGKKILPTVLVLFILVGLSFLFTKDYTVTNLSNRLFFYGGLGFMVLGSIVVFAQMITGRSMQIFGKSDFDSLKKSASQDANTQLAKEKSYNVGAQLWWIGVFCILASMVYDLIF